MIDGGAGSRRAKARVGRRPSVLQHDAGNMIHDSLNLPTSVVITGIDSMKILKQAFEAARTSRPLTKQQVAKLTAKSASAAAAGEYELLKTALSKNLKGPIRAWSFRE